MKKSLLSILFVPILILQLFAMPSLALAADNGTPGHIIPDCNRGVVQSGEHIGQLANSQGEYDPCDFEDLIQLIRNIIRFIVLYLTAPALTIGFAYAGFLLLTSGGNSGKRGQAKDMLGKVAMGLVAMIAAWFIIEAIYSGLGYGGFLQFS